MARVSVIGTGYVGATTAIMLAKLGHSVIAYDIDLNKINLLKLGKLPIYEPGLGAHLVEGIESKNLIFTSSMADAVKDSDFVFICVPTPQAEDGSADLRFVLEAAGEAAPFLHAGTVVVTKSTVPVGAADAIKAKINRSDIDVASNPEFLREGTAVKDFLSPDRIVIGSTRAEVGTKLAALYSELNANVLLTDPKSAELIKYASNSFLAMKLSFVNELARLCEMLGADIQEVMTGFGLDSRIGEKFTNPGPGWGGSCFPKDVAALRALGSLNQVELKMIEATLESNQTTKKHVVSRLRKKLNGELAGKNIAILGLTFKAFTDDLRESPAVEIAEQLVRQGAIVKAFDPEAKAEESFNFEFVESQEIVAENADALLVLTEWPQFGEIDAKSTLAKMRGNLIFDTRAVLNENNWVACGANFIRVGVK